MTYSNPNPHGIINKCVQVVHVSQQNLSTGMSKHLRSYVSLNTYD